MAGSECKTSAVAASVARGHVFQLHQERYQPGARIHARESQRRSAIDQRQVCPPPYPVEPQSRRGSAKQADQHLEKGGIRDAQGAKQKCRRNEKHGAGGYQSLVHGSPGDMRIARLDPHFAATRTLLKRTPVAGPAAAYWPGCGVISPLSIVSVTSANVSSSFGFDSVISSVM